METNNRFTRTESVYETAPFQDERLTHAPLCAPEEHACGKDRLKRCLYQWPVISIPFCKANETHNLS